MRKKFLLWGAVAMAIASGCERRADYLEPQTDNVFVKNTGRVINTIMPLGTAANILISEMARDTQRCDERGHCDK